MNIRQLIVFVFTIFTTAIVIVSAAPTPAPVCTSTVCLGTNPNCDAACDAAGKGACVSKSCAWSGICPSGAVDAWCLDSAGLSACSWAGDQNSAFCKCETACATATPTPTSTPTPTPTPTPHPVWVATGTDLNVCEPPKQCYALGCNAADGSCTYSFSPPGTDCTGGKCCSGICDGAAPTTTDNSDSGWHKSNVVITLTCSDPGGCGCSYTKYCTGILAICTPATAYAGPVTLTSTGYIRYYSADTVGNTEGLRTSKRIKIDKIKPVVTISQPAEDTTVWAPVRLKVRVYDTGGSGVKLVSSVKIKKDGALLHTYTVGECTKGSGTPGNPYVCVWDWMSAPDDMGTHTFVAEAADVAGNSGVSSEVNVMVGCASTFDCVASTVYGPKNYCPSSTHVCTPCLRDQDFYCPDLECLDVDLDCCSTTVSCPSGLYCELGGNTCYAKRGNFCSTQADCTPETYCSKDAQVCVLKNFVSVRPEFAKVTVGERSAFDVVLVDPVNRTATYELSISGTGKYYAKFFGTQTKLKVTLKADEVKTIPLSFSAGAAGQFTIEVEAVDSKYYANGGTVPAGIKSHSAAQVTVDAVTKTPFIVSSPGPSIAELIAIALLASLLIF